jgi:hypothetical protein
VPDALSPRLNWESHPPVFEPRRSARGGRWSRARHEACSTWRSPDGACGLYRIEFLGADGYVVRRLKQVAGEPAGVSARNGQHVGRASTLNEAVSLAEADDARLAAGR